MKKSFLALAVAAVAATAISATTVNATTVYDKDGTSLSVYGRVQSVYYSDKTASAASNEEGTIRSSARLGFDFRTQLTSGIAGFAKAEWEAAADDNSQFTSRYMWVGADFGQFGLVKVGKFEEAIKYAIGPTDIFDDWGCTGLAGNDDRREGVVQYQWNGYGVDAIISYAFANDGEQLDGAYFTGENVDLDYSFSAALGYTSPEVLFGPIGVRIGYAMGQFADDYNGANGANVFSNTAYDEYDQFAVSAFWGGATGPYIAAAYQKRTFDYLAYANGLEAASTGSGDYSVEGYEFVVAYVFQNGVKLATGFEQQNVDFDDGDDLEAATIPVYANWHINPQFNIWAEARFDAGTDDDDVGGKNFDRDLNNLNTKYAENVFSIGARYSF